MKLNDYISKIFNENPTAVMPIENGLTNDNYVVTLSHKTVVFRIPKVGNDLLFDYLHESHVLSIIQQTDLDVPLIYYNPKTGVKCTEYIPNTSNFDIKYLTRAAHLIRKLHNLDVKSGKTFNLLEMIASYRSRINEPLYDLTCFDIYLNDLRMENITLCHNDLVKGNFLFSSEKDYLIDYEYAMDNDPFFDVMSFITENDIQDANDRAIFYHAYFGTTPTQDDYHHLKQYECAHHILWCTWAMMMAEKYDDLEYIRIRDLKYKRLLELVSGNTL